MIYSVNKPNNSGGSGVYCSKKVLGNEYSCLAESKSLVIKSSSVEEVHFQVVKVV
jgi:hypothetical protein